MKKVLFLVPLFLLLSAFRESANPDKPSHAIKNGGTFVGGDFSLDFVASAPLTYNHATGGGFYNDRTIGRDQDVVESLEGGDFTCGDHVSYLTAIKVSKTATSQNQTIELDYSFLAAATGQPGVALCQIAYVGVNTGDGGIISVDNDETATLLGPAGGTINGTLFQKGATLTGTVQITGLDPGETIIVRTDVLLCCQVPSSPTGNLQASIVAGRVTSPQFNKRDATISVGQQTVPFKNVNLIAQGDCTLADNTAVCEGGVLNYTASSANSTTPTFSWTLTGDAIFVDANGQPTTPGNTATVHVQATTPSGATGCFKLSVDVSSDQHTPVTCCDVVSVYAIPPAPAVAIVNPTICGSSPNGTVTVTCPTNPSTGDPIYEYQNGSGAWTTNPEFSLAAGAGFSIRVRRIGTTCASTATDCSNYTTNTANCAQPSAGASCALSCGTTSLSTAKASPKVGMDVALQTSIRALPNPYSDKINFEIKPAESGLGSLELYNTLGQRVKTVFRGYVKAGQVQKIEYAVPGPQRSNLIYVFRVGSQKTTGKLIGMK